MRNLRAKTPALELVRFFLVATAGLLIDIGIAWALIALAGSPDALAAVVGFSVATIANYLGHQFWTFQAGERRASVRRFLAFAGVVAATLAVRLGVLEQLGPLLPGTGLAAPARLGLAAVASFAVSFVLSKLLVFKPNGDGLAGQIGR